MFSLPFWDCLAQSKRVLIVGAGGGFDVYAGLPIALALECDVWLANLSFVYFGDTSCQAIAPGLFEVRASDTGSARYFPERSLARWFEQSNHGQHIQRPIYGLEKTGVPTLRAALEVLIAKHSIDTLILVDGGSDLLMFGDEVGLGSPAEDFATLAAASTLQVPTKLIASIGLGIDRFHGVSGTQFLENVATLERDGGYLGSFSLPRSLPAVQGYLDAVAFAHDENPDRASIVNGGIAASIEGKFARAKLYSDERRFEHTLPSEVFVSPLMSMFFTFQLDAVVRRNLCLPAIAHTRTIFDVNLVIEAFRHDVVRRVEHTPTWLEPIR